MKRLKELLRSKTHDGEPRPHSPVRRIVIAIAGGILIILGLVGWIVPIIPGFPLIIVGVPMVIAVHPALDRAARRWARRLYEKLRHARVFRSGGSR